MSLESTRREFLKQTSALSVAAGTGGLFSLAGCAKESPQGTKPGDSAIETTTKEATDAKRDTEVIPIVDTHQHLWDLEKLTLPWLKNDAVQSINHSYLMSDYLEATQGLNVVKTVYMEVNVDSSQFDKEAEYVIELCKDDSNPMVAAVIGGSPQSKEFRAYIEKYADSEYVKGVRTVLHDSDRKKGMCLKSQFVENIKLLGELGMSYDLCMRPDEVVDGVELVKQCPKTRFIIDHCGNMSVVEPDESEGKEAVEAYKTQRKLWMQGLQAAAQQENVVCKISGIVVTAKKDEWKPSDLAPNTNFCMDTFGEDRIFFGGDWPVCTLKASYNQWANALKEIVKDRSPEFKQKLFHDNAVRIYGLS